MGQLNDIVLYFQHYKTSEDAKKKWIERSHRVDSTNLFFIMSINGNVENAQKLIQEFNCLKSPHVIFTDTGSKIKGDNIFYCGRDRYGFFHGYVSDFSIKKHFDKFDFVGWFNK